MNDINNNRKSPIDGRMILATVLSVVVITAGVVINDIFWPVKPATTTTSAAQAAPATGSQAAPAAAVPASSSIRAADSAFVAAPAAPSATAPAGTKAAPAGTAAPAEAAPALFTVNTDLLEAVFTNKGGNLVSLKLKQHKDSGQEVNLLFPGQKDAEAFTVGFGAAGSAPLNDIMDVRMIDETTIEFSRVYLADVPGRDKPTPFTYRKVFTFRNGEYLFGLAIALENSVNEILPLNANGQAYTLAFAPQVGPSYNPASKNSDYRKVFTFVDGKRKEEKIKNTPWTVKGQPSWIDIGGKYFVFLEIPQVPNYTATFTSTNSTTFGQTTKIELSRPAIGSSKQVDTYYFYFGPKTNALLAKYNFADDNGFQMADLHLESAVDSSGILSWLEVGLKFLLNIFYKLVPNFGVAIILLTLLVKALLFPMTKKGSIASAKMSELQPQIQALQAKYKNNPEKLNKEMAEFYKTSGANPMSGCLPLLIQFPIFIAMYNLFNTHFDLRGAMFIPGWIPDLSAPETVWNFAPFKLPLLGWSDLRALPIIYLVSQLVYGKFTQQPTTGPAATQMKIMMYGMPIFFFFILYDVPAGLLVYWIASNLLTIVQQIAINRIIKRHKQSQPTGPKLVKK